MSRFLVALADAGPESGLGHLARCSAVVVALRTRGVEVRCVAVDAKRPIELDGVVWEPGDLGSAARVLAGVDAVLLDTYNLPEELWVSRPRLASFHDPGQPEPVNALLVVDPSLPAAPAPHWLCGLQHACLRAGYWGVPAAAVPAVVERVLVTTGGTDPGEISRALAIAARRGIPAAQVRRVRGPAAAALEIDGVVELDALESLRAELGAAGIVLCLGGQTALEAACLGVPAVAFAAVENQRGNVELLAAAGAVEVGETGDGLARLLGALAGDHERRLERARAARLAVDGYGALRVAAALEPLL